MNGGAPHARKLTPLYHRHLELKARLHEEDGWMVPESYEGAELELGRTADSCGVSDISTLAKIDIRGRRLDAFLLRTLGASLAGRPGSTAPLRAATGNSGLAMRYLCRLAPDGALLVGYGRPSTGTVTPMDVDAIPQSEGVYLTNVSSVLAGINIVGPASPRVLSRLTEVDVDPEVFVNLSCVQAGLAKVNALVVRFDLELGDRPLPSYEVFVGADVAEYVWDAILSVDRGAVRPFGTSAGRLMRAGARMTAEEEAS